MLCCVFSCISSLSTSRTSLAGDSDSFFDFHSPVNNLLSKLTKVSHSTGFCLYYVISQQAGWTVLHVLNIQISFRFHSVIIISVITVLLQHMRSPSVSCLDVDTSPPTNESSPATLTPTTPTKSHRRSASCGNNPPGNIQGSGADMRIIRIRMDLEDGNLYRSILVRIPTNHLSLIKISRISTEAFVVNYQ